MNDISLHIREISGVHFTISETEKSFASVSVMACTATATATVLSLLTGKNIVYSICAKKDRC